MAIVSVNVGAGLTKNGIKQLQLIGVLSAGREFDWPDARV